MDCMIFNVRTGVNACGCTRGCTDTIRESTLKVDTWRKIPCRTWESNLRQRRAGPTELHPHPDTLSVSQVIKTLFLDTDDI